MNRSQIRNPQCEAYEKESSSSSYRYSIKSNIIKDEVVKENQQHVEDDNNKSFNIQSEVNAKKATLFDYTGISMFFKDKSQNGNNSSNNCNGIGIQPIENIKKILTESNSKINFHANKSLENSKNNIHDKGVSNDKSMVNDKSNTYIKNITSGKNGICDKGVSYEKSIMNEKSLNNMNDIETEYHRKNISRDIDDHQKQSLGFICEMSNNHQAKKKVIPMNTNGDEDNEDGDKGSEINNGSIAKEISLALLHKPSRNVNLDEKIIERIKNKVKPKSNLNTSKTPNESIQGFKTSQPTLQAKTDGVFQDTTENLKKNTVLEKPAMESVIEKNETEKSMGSCSNQASSIYDYKNTEVYADSHEIRASQSKMKDILAKEIKINITSEPVDNEEEDNDDSEKEDDLLVKKAFNNINRPLFLDLETQFLTPRIEITQPSSTTSSQPAAKPISNSSSFFVDELNQNLLGDWIWRKTPTEETFPANKFKPNLSILSAESTIDSDNIGVNTIEHNNNSFTTHLGASLNNSGRMDFNSPYRIENGIYVPDGRCDPNLYMVHPQNNPSNFGVFNHKLQQIFPNSGRIPANLNNSCINFFSANSFNDHNSSFSLNIDDINTFGNTYTTPQGRQQHQGFFAQNQSFSYKPNDNMMDQYYMHNNNTQGMGLMSSKLPDQLNFNHTPSSNGNSNNSGKMFMSMSAQTQMNYKSATRLNKRAYDQDDSSLIYDIDVNKLDDPRRTTLMIKNIPNKYDRNLILQTIDKNHKGKYDFFYLPIDFKNRCNVGYAFINFIDPKHIKGFYDEFNGKRWEKFNSEKICVLKYARIQGRAALIQHFQFSSVMNQQDKKLKPLILPNQSLSHIEEIVKQQKANLNNEYN